MENLGAIALAVVVVVVARAAAVLLLVSALERFAGIPPVGRRNEAVLIWGGPRGGVALAVTLPQSLAQRETFIAMTGGVVLATLLINATTISWLVHRLGLNKPSRAERYLAGVARLAGLRAARERLDDLGLDDRDVSPRLEQEESSTREELGRIQLDREEELRVVTSRGLAVQRETYQRLSDSGLPAPTPARALLRETDDRIEELGLGHIPAATQRREPPRIDRPEKRLHRVAAGAGGRG